MMKFLIALAFCVSLVAASTFRKPPIAFVEDLKVDPDLRIISGRVAAPGQFPHQVFNIFTLTDGNYSCAASLICDSWVLTAAHCAQGANQFFLYFGSVNRSQEYEQGRVVLQTTNKYVHLGYNTTNLNNDIALIRLHEKINFTDKIQPIPLATHRTAAGQKVTVSGWGRTRQDSDISPILMYAELDTISNEECAGVYGSDAIRNETLCCRGRPQHSTCKGDSGGPLIEWVNNRWVLSGVISFVHTAGCASGNPSGYIRVESYLNWIHGIIGDTCHLPN